MINFAKRMIAVLVTAVAIVIPLLNFGPKLYQWVLEVYMGKLYRRLRDIETTLRNELTAAQVAVMQTELENIDRATNILPMRHSDLYFDLKLHINQVRT